MTLDQLVANYERYVAFDDRWNDRRNWRDYKACRGADPDLFFPGTDDYEPPYAPPEVKEICDFCPVRGDCLADGIEEEYGIWGGLTGYQRRQMRRPRERAACLGCGSTDVVVEHGQEVCLACGISWDVV